MHDFAVRTPEQLPGLLKSLRKASGLTQLEVAARLGISQQTLSAMERRATTVGAARLMGLLNVLGVELVLRQQQGTSAQAVYTPGTALLARDSKSPW